MYSLLITYLLRHKMQHLSMAFVNGPSKLAPPPVANDTRSSCLHTMAEIYHGVCVCVQSTLQATIL